MPEVKVNREKSLARQETPGSRLPGELFRPMFPFGRYFGFSPFGLMREFSEEMDRIFGGSAAGGETTMWSPVVDVQRTDGNLVVTAELPGLKKDEVKVELTEDALVIEGERKREQKEEREGFYRSERSYGHFYRSIPLPEGAKADQAKAELNEGVLKVSIPVPETQKKTRQIPIEGGTKPASA